ncbi:hypothetical protein QLX08_004405 [Tetragonisca angustula]|uniref:Uncharacterized protein n=1 Tax=Tetragonisca angustula TaxID=166442 RepID=A0AAW1A4Q1_9HYME
MARVKKNKWSLFVKQTSTKPSRELLEKIRKQIEFYFDVNMRKEDSGIASLYLVIGITCVAIAVMMSLSCIRNQIFIFRQM